jgi:UDP-N-acetylmuramoylalanine--D-glutamate ligase
MLAEELNQDTPGCPEIFTHKRVLVVGLGKTGMSCVHFLQRRGVKFAVADSRLLPPGLKELQEEYPDVPVFLGEFDPQVFAHIDVLVVSPGVSIQTPVITASVQRGAEILGDIEIFARCVDKPVIAITGSNGKSTVTSLVGEMVRQAKYTAGVGANLGIPALELIESKPDVYVLELSSFQLETTYSLNAQASTILNISEDHMDRYASLAEYAQAKAIIFNGNGVVVINEDDPIVKSFAKELTDDRIVYRFKMAEPNNDHEFGVVKVAGESWLACGNSKLLRVSEMKIKGQHNVANALAALALGTAAHLPIAAMLTALRAFPGLPHRSQWITEQNGVAWYNDSKGTNVGASLAAIAGIPANKLLVILGGLGKGQDFSPLREPLAQRARHVFLLGQDAQKIAAALQDVVPITYVKDLDEAVIKAKSLAQAGDAVLLSPACASFDMFSGYEQRGEVFIHRVQAHNS